MIPKSEREEWIEGKKGRGRIQENRLRKTYRKETRVQEGKGGGVEGKTGRAGTKCWQGSGKVTNHNFWSSSVHHQ